MREGKGKASLLEVLFFSMFMNKKGGYDKKKVIEGEVDYDRQKKNEGSNVPCNGILRLVHYFCSCKR